MGVVVLLLLLFGTVAAVAPPETQEAAVRALATRLLGEHFALNVTVVVAAAEESDRFSVECDGSALRIVATSGVAAASGLNHFLQRGLNMSVSWLGDNVVSPWPPGKTLPPFIARNVRTPFARRYYFNVCTMGYSTAFWQWPRWEREIDLMALNGIDTPLAFVGQELAWLRTFAKFGVPQTNTSSSFFTGPAYLPWQRMGNIDAFLGPLPISWIERQAQLGQTIVKRMREFGMHVVLPAFAGHVPREFGVVHPKAAIHQLAPWSWEFEGTFFLDVMDPLFLDVGAEFIRQITTIFGNDDHLYNGDPFNEMVPPSEDPAWLGKASLAILSSLQAGDPDAVWVLQGWFLAYQADWWSSERAHGFLDTIPEEKLIVLDLWAERRPVWKENLVYGKRFIWNMLHNFGGRNDLYGSIDDVARGLHEALTNGTAKITGAGLTPEGIESNVVVYELMHQLFWTADSIDVDTFLCEFAQRRYGTDNPAFCSAWRILRETVYRVNTTRLGAPPDHVTSRPNMTMDAQNFYSPAALCNVWKIFVNSIPATPNAPLQYDLAMVSAQSLVNLVGMWHEKVVRAFEDKSSAELAKRSAELLEMIEGIDAVLASNAHTLLGKWLEDAKSWAVGASELSQFERNARRQVTLWGKRDSPHHDYAAKLWSGLVGTFYHERWRIFVASLSDALAAGRAWDQAAFLESVKDFELGWTEQQTLFPTKPKGDTAQIAKALFEKYGSLL